MMITERIAASMLISDSGQWLTLGTYLTMAYYSTSGVDNVMAVGI